MRPFIIDKLRKQKEKEKFKDERPRLYIPEIEYDRKVKPKEKPPEERGVYIIPPPGEDSEEG